MRYNRLIQPITVLLLLVFATACKPSADKKELTDSWTMIRKTTAGFEITESGKADELIRITTDSLIHKAPMEDVEFKTDHIKETADGAIYYPKKDEQAFYKFTWVDQQKGIASCQISTDGASVTKYFVNQAGLPQIKTKKSNEADLVAASAPGDPIKDSLVLGDSKKTLYIESDDCISIRNNQGDQLYEHCFEGFILRIRPQQGEIIPLTFISGAHAIDIDFYPTGSDWVSKTATYFSPQANAKQGITKPHVVSIKNFDFDAVVTEFSGSKNNK